MLNFQHTTSYGKLPNVLCWCDTGAPSHTSTVPGTRYLVTILLGSCLFIHICCSALPVPVSMFDHVVSIFKLVFPVKILLSSLLKAKIGLQKIRCAPFLTLNKNYFDTHSSHRKARRLLIKKYIEWGVHISVSPTFEE